MTHWVFWSFPSTIHSSSFLGRLKKVELKKAQALKTLGIFNLIQLSKTGLGYEENLILAEIHFWENSINTMHLKCGMLSPTLLDVAAITRLPPIGETYDLDRENKTQFELSVVAYGAFINKYFDKNTTEVSDEKHIAFLSF